MFKKTSRYSAVVKCLGKAVSASSYFQGEMKKCEKKKNTCKSSIPCECEAVQDLGTEIL